MLVVLIDIVEDVLGTGRESKEGNRQRYHYIFSHNNIFLYVTFLECNSKSTAKTGSIRNRETLKVTTHVVVTL